MADDPATMAPAQRLACEFLEAHRTWEAQSTLVEKAHEALSRVETERLNAALRLGRECRPTSRSPRRAFPITTYVGDVATTFVALVEWNDHGRGSSRLCDPGGRAVMRRCKKCGATKDSATCSGLLSTARSIYASRLMPADNGTIRFLSVLRR